MKITATLKATLHALRQVGTVRGVCLCQNGGILENLFPFSTDRMQSFCDEGVNLFADFSARGRDVERLVMGFDGGQLVMLADGDLLLLLIHLIPDEADFVAKAGRAFLNDYRAEYGAAENVVPFPEAVRQEPVEIPQEPVETQQVMVEIANQPATPMTFRELLAAAVNAPEQNSAEHSLLAEARTATEKKSDAQDSQVAKPEPQPEPKPAAFAARAQRKVPITKRIVGEVVVQPARLAAQQPKSTLPPQKTPRVRSRRRSS